MTRALLTASLVAGLLGCIDSAQDRVVFPLQVAGTEPESPIAGRDGWLIALDRADLAFGPLYLCAGFQAGELCETARAEWLDSVVVDALSNRAIDAGTIDGVTGRVLSWMYDHGLTSLLTLQEPLELSAATQLGGHSLIAQGTAVRDTEELPFVAEIPIAQQEETEIGIPVVRKSLGDAFDHDIQGDDELLRVRFDPAPWFAGVDFGVFTESATCEPEGRQTVCAGALQQRCAADGSTEATVDCAERRQICVPDIGCTDRAHFAPDTQPYRAVRNAVASGQRPTFTWDGS